MFEQLKKIHYNNRFKKVATACRINASNPGAAEYIATEIFMLLDNKNTTYLTANKYTLCDMVLFSSFIARIMYGGACDSARKHADFCSSFTAYINNGIISLYKVPALELKQLSSNRYAFYSELFDKTAKEQVMTEAIQELGQILLHDKAFNSCQMYSSESPLLLADIFEKFHATSEVKAFCETIISIIRVILKEVEAGRM